MNDCTCGAPRKQFWLWRDGNGTLHASHFRPTNGLVRSVLAVTARDALLPLLNSGHPRHRVTDADDPGADWLGRCTAQA